MYLSRVKLSTNFVLSRLAERAQNGDAYAQHQWLWQLFPDQQNRDFLFRYEKGLTGSCYYLLSKSQPSDSLMGVELSSKVFHPQLNAGDRLAYTLRANPTRMLKSKAPGKRGSRVDVLMHAKHQARQSGGVNDIEIVQQQAAREWLAAPERQKNLGVTFVTEPEVTEHRQHQIYKSRRDSGQSKPIQFTSINYQGVLEVVNPDRFIEQLFQGVGRAKALGCGLMMIKPCR